MKTNKSKPTRTFLELFDIILNGDKEKSRKAAREVRELLYQSSLDYKSKFDEIKSITENVSEEYRSIVEDWRQENFVIAVSVLYYLHGKENRPDFLFPWLFYLLKHKNGNIRQSAVRMIGNELGPLTFHIRCPEYEHNKLRTEQSDFILLNLFIGLNSLLADVWKSKYKKYKYISSLPTCSYKSIQMVLSNLEDSCGKEYVKILKQK